jgi:xanthine dehydrogenase accessory factor
VLPVATLPLSEVLAATAPRVLIDARMRKREVPEVQRGLAPLVIGLGPNFVAGQNADLVVETMWGDDLGRVFDQGATQPLQGEPRPIAGVARARYVYAPITGQLQTRLQIGSAVVQGDEVARIGTVRLLAPVTGVLRGLTRDGVAVQMGTKVIEVDPRGEPDLVKGIGERPARIADGVFQAVEAWRLAQAP